MCGQVLQIPARDDPFGSFSGRQTPLPQSPLPQHGFQPQQAAPEREFPTGLVVGLGLGTLLLLACVAVVVIVWDKVSEANPVAPAAAKDPDVVSSSTRSPRASGTATPVSPAPTVVSSAPQAASGEPMTASELEAFYRLPPGARDTTALWVSAGEQLATGEYEAATGNLPIIGTTTDVTIPLPGQPWPDLARAKAHVSQYEGVIQLAFQAAEQQGGARYPTNFANGLEMPLPEVQNARAVSRLLTLASVVAAHAGDAHRSALALRAALASANSLDGFPLAVAGLVRIAIAVQAEDRLLQLLPHVPFTDADLLMLRTEIERLQAGQGVREQLIGERVLGLVAFERPKETLKLAMEGGLSGVPEVVNPAKLQTLEQVVVSTVAVDRAYYLQLMERALAATEKPLPEAMDAIEELNRERQQDPARTQHVLSHLIMTPCTPLVQAHGRLEVIHRIALTSLAIERFRRQEGAAPQSLEQLVPRYLSSVPLDPFDGQPLRFVVRGGHCLLYSVGYNRRDEGGQVDPADVTDISRRLATSSRATPHPPVVSSEPTIPPQVTPVAGAPIDLLATFKVPPPPGTTRGQWSTRNGVLHSNQQDRAAYVAFPVDLPKNYRVTAVVEVLGGEGSFNLAFTVDGRPAMLVLDGWRRDKSGLNLVDNKTGDNNETTYSGPVLQRGRPNNVELSVIDGQIGAAVNGRRMVDWRGDSKRLSLDQRFWPVVDNRLYIGNWETHFRVSRLELTPLD